MVGMSGRDAVITKKCYGSGNAALLILNIEIEHAMKIAKSLEKSGLQIKGISETTKNDAKDQNDEFLGILLGTLETIFWERCWQKNLK